MIFRRRDNDGFEPFSLTRMLAAPFRAIGRSVGGLLDRDDSMHVNKSLFSRFVGLLTLPLRMAIAFISFMIHGWASTRPGYAFLKGLPAVGAISLFFGGLLVSDFVYNEARLIGTNYAYLALQQTTQPENPEYSEMFAERLVEIKPDVDEHKYQLGLAYERSGKTVSAVDVMTSIAPGDRSGHSNAHVWLARYYLRPNPEELDNDKRVELVQKHLDYATSVDPENQLALVSLAGLYLDQASREEKGSDVYKGHLQSAVLQLTEVANGPITINQVRAIPRLLELQLELGQEELAKLRMDWAIQRLLPIARLNPDVYELWLTLVRCSVLLKDYSQALDIVKEGLQLSKDATVKRNILQLASLIYQQKANDFQDMTDRDQYGARLNGLCEAIRLNPTDQAIFLKLLDFVSSRQPTTVPEQSAGQANLQAQVDFSGVDEIWLLDSVIGSPAPGVVHALLGMRSINQGNIREGEKHWRIAEQQFPNTQIVVNNLIDVASKNRPDDFPNILSMITLAIELFPEQPILYQTRGVYLKNRGDLESAVADFKYAAEKMPRMISLHKYLINCYKQLGDQQQVTEQQILLEKKLSELNPGDRKLVEASMDRLD